MKNQNQTASEVKNSSRTRTLAHETRKNKQMIIMFAFLVFAIVAGLLVGCQKEATENEPLDKAILNSTELEEYIIAAADFQQSLAGFTAGLNKIDFSTLKVTYDAEGREIVHLPSAVVGSFRIEEKVENLNRKRDALRKKFPQISSFREEKSKEYFKQSIQNSINIQGAFLKLGIFTSQPRLKNGSEYGNYTNGWDECYLNSFLYNYLFYANSSYVEILILKHADGTWSTYIDYENDANNAYFRYNIIDGNLYAYGGHSSPVVEIGHTHLSSSSPSSQDYPNYPGLNYNLNHFIYYYGFDYY